MQFDLTEALIDQLLFSMEDQEHDHVLDVRGNLVISSDEITQDPESGPYIPIPEWSSADGFQLMEKFAAGLRNPIVRDELSTALDRGKGVFRAFKDVLNNRPEVERLWFNHKEREMRRQILNWYNALREEWGLERLGEEPEETADLLLEDFRFKNASSEDLKEARKLHELCLNEFLMAGDGTDSEQTPEAVIKERADSWVFPGDICIIAETGRGDFAGYLNAVKDGTTAHIVALEIHAEFRGLGIGEALIQKFIDQVTQEDISAVLLRLPSISEGFSRVLLRSGFHPYETRYSLFPQKNSLD